MALCDSPEWKAGHRLGEIGKPLPPEKPDKPRTKQFAAGYAYGLRTLAWTLWCKRNNRTAVYTGEPWPETDPPPMTHAECTIYVGRFGA